MSNAAWDIQKRPMRSRDCSVHRELQQEIHYRVIAVANARVSPSAPLLAKGHRKCFVPNPIESTRGDKLFHPLALALWTRYN